VGFKNGMRVQNWFKSENDAQKAVDDLNAEITAHGTQFALSSADRLRASHAAERLRPYGKTIDDVVNFYVAYLEQLAASVPFSKLATQIREEFKRRANTNEASVRHIETVGR
jgi:hypothetical protein